MIKFRFLILFLSLNLFLQHNSYGQENDNQQKRLLRNTTFWTELGGHGLAYSVGLEQILINSDYKLTIQAAVAYYPKFADLIPLWVPVTMNQLFPLKKEKNFIEFGMGVMLLQDKIIFSGSQFTENNMDNVIFRLGYRLRNPVKKYDLRISFTPILLDAIDNIGRASDFKTLIQSQEFIPLFGVGFGLRL